MDKRFSMLDKVKLMKIQDLIDQIRQMQISKNALYYAEVEIKILKILTNDSYERIKNLEKRIEDTLGTKKEN